MESGNMNRSGLVDESFIQQYEVMKDDYDALRKRYADLIASHTGTVHKLELSQDELGRFKALYEEAGNAIKERNALKQQCTSAIRQWDAALQASTEYKEALNKVQQQHEEAMKEINQAMAARIKANKDIKKLTEERDAALQEYSLIMSERDSVHRELEKLTDDLGGSKKLIKNLESMNKELQEKLAEATKEADIAKMRRDWAFSERDKIVGERESLRALCDRLRKERDRAGSKLAEVLRESDIASKQLKELRDKMEFEKENHPSMRLQYFSNSSSFSESKDSAIDSDMPTGHYSIKLPNIRGTDHGLVLEPGVYISRILPGSPASRQINLNVGDRVLYINDSAIDNVNDAILALSEDIDPIVLTLSRSAGGHLSPISATASSHRSRNQLHNSKASAHASSSSIRSDKSDPNSILSDGRRPGGSGNSAKMATGGGGFGFFKVRLPRKKPSSPEEEILATLDSAIASGAGAAGVTGGTGKKNKKRRENKRITSRNSASDNMNKNGTWPRVILSRNSYTLPQEGDGDCARAAVDSVSPAIYHRESSYNGQGQYVPVGLSSITSNTVCVRRNNNGRDRVPLSSMLWDLQSPPQASKSVGAIAAMPGGLGVMGASSSAGGSGPLSGGGRIGGTSPYGHTSAASKSLTLGGQVRGGRGGGLLSLDSHGLPAPTQVPHHRYSYGMYDPTPSNKHGKGVPDRNSVVPTLTMSDGSSIDFSVKSGPGNMEILEYYVKRIKPSQNNSSESDHLDKVITPPSLALHTIPTAKSSSMSNCGYASTAGGPSSQGATSTLDRYHNRYSYTGHYHNGLMGFGGGGSTLASPSAGNMTGTLPLPVPKHTSSSSRNSTYSFDPASFTYGLTGGGGHLHGGNNNSVLYSVPTRMNFRNSDDLLLQPNYYTEPSGTFPRKREPHRIRIPSNQSVTSRSSTEKVDLRNSPMPTYQIEVLDPGVSPSPGPGTTEYGVWPRKPAHGELRMIRLDKYDKSNEFLGIQISCKKNGGGVFVSSVTENSLASQVGLQVGDQLLEVCGINMRTAAYELAAKVLRESGDSLTLLVQYFPDKYFARADDPVSSSDDSHSERECSSPENEDHNSLSSDDNESRSRSDSPTPCNSPQSTLVRNSKKTSSVLHKHTRSTSSQNNPSKNNSSANNSLTKNKQHQNAAGGGGLSQLQQQQLQQAFASLSTATSQERNRGDRDPPSEHSTLRSTRGSGGGGGGLMSISTGVASGSVAENSVGEGTMLLQDNKRFLTLQLMKNSSNLGICLVGGNLVGIFVHSVQTESVADRAGMRSGDQILEYNGTDLRHATAEEAAFELAKPLDKVGILVQYNLQRYNDVKDKPGDGFYIRALFDFPSLSGDHHHQSGQLDPNELTFQKDEILYVDNTMYNGKPGRWRAWKVDAEGHTRMWGVIPSKYKVEEDMLFKRGLGVDLDDRRSSTVTRRSFFRRKSHHRSSSRELASFSDFSINSYGDLIGQHCLATKEGGGGLHLMSYQRVERLDYMSYLRPVILIGALSDLITDKLVQDFPSEFGKVPVESMRCDGEMLQEGLTGNIFVDYKRKGSHYDCVTMAAIHEVRSRKLFCLMDISTAGVDRLQRAHMYPIVLLIKFKSHNQIREIKDLRGDKLSQKAASKELYEHSLKVESEYKNLITAYIPGGTNISYLATQVRTAVQKEHSKTLWVPAS